MHTRCFGLALIMTQLACTGGATPSMMGDEEDLPIPVEQRTLGMNDVSILVPLPADPALPILLRASDASLTGAPIVPRALWDRIVLGESGMPDVTIPYEELQVVAVRFDLCARAQPGRCPPDADGELRLVLQPLSRDLGAADAALHALYTIPRDERAGAISDLRALGVLAGGPTTAPLQPSPALVAAPAGPYADGLRAFVRRHADPARLARLTFFAQPAFFAAIRWVMRGLERDGADYVPLVIPAIEAPAQAITLLSSATFQLAPGVDAPTGLLVAASTSKFAAASAEGRAIALAALAAIDDPRRHTADTLQCATCHLASIARARRGAESGLSVEAVDGRYTSAYDLSIASGMSSSSDRTLRAFGWLGRAPFIAQRVANETAHVLVELERQFPAPH